MLEQNVVRPPPLQVSMRPLDSATSKSIHIQIDRSASEIAVVAAHKLPWKNLCEIKIQELTLKAEILGNTILYF